MSQSTIHYTDDEVIDVIAERLQIVLEFSAAMERIQIIDGRPLS